MGAAAFLAGVTETQYMRTIRSFAETLGYRCFHNRYAVGSDPGFPDLFCVRPGRAVAIEVKGPRGKASDAQIEWLELLGSVPGVVGLLAYPGDWSVVEIALKGEV